MISCRLSSVLIFLFSLRQANTLLCFCAVYVLLGELVGIPRKERAI